MPKWYKSSYSGTSSDCVEVTHNPWHTASHSAAHGECVEVSEGAVTGIRDTQNRELGALFFSPDEWRFFLTSTQNNMR